MKRWASLLLTIALLLGSAACAAPAYEVIEDAGDHTYEENGVVLARLTARFPQITRLADTAAMDRVNHSIQDHIRLEGGYDGVCEAAYGDYLAKVTDFSQMSYELFVKAEALQKAERLFSVLYAFSAYTGGAHPENWSAAEHYDLRTGDRVILEQLVEDIDVFHAQVAESLLDQIRSSPLAKEGLLFEGYESDVRNWHIEQAVLDQAGLLVFFNPYEIAPYAAGTLYFPIPYGKIDAHWNALGKELLRK